MEYIDEISMQDILRRTNLIEIRNVILDGLNPEDYNLSYNERIRKGCREMLKRLNKIYKDDEDGIEYAICEYSAATTAYKEVFTEIGMIIGARLLFQLLYQGE